MIRDGMRPLTVLKAIDKLLKNKKDSRAADEKMAEIAAALAKYELGSYYERQKQKRAERVRQTRQQETAISFWA